MNYEIKHLTTTDLPLFQKVIALFHRVFEMEGPVTAGKAYLQKLLDMPGFVVYAAMHNNEVIGGLTAYELPMYYAEGAEMFIYDIAISAKFQRQGLGKKLMAAVAEYCAKNGIKEMFVPAHEADEHALDFYRSAGGEEEKVRHFNFAIKQKEK